MMRIDKKQIEELYKELYTASIMKDESILEAVLADDYCLVHMTGMRQTKKEYIEAVLDGTLNYFSSNHVKIEITILGEHEAMVDGKSLVAAAVFGGGTHTWRLRQKMKVRRVDSTWKIYESVASTY